MRRLWEFAALPANDAVKLALLHAEDGPEAVDGLELSLLSEIRRSANGTLELRLADRLGALRLLAELLGGDEEGAARFFRAMEKAAEHGDDH
jgi:hypothetical protein